MNSEKSSEAFARTDALLRFFLRVGLGSHEVSIVHSKSRGRRR